MNKEYPIIFLTEMVKAILEDRKSQTRRVIKPQPKWASLLIWKPMMKNPPAVLTDDVKQIIPYCPYGKPGDRLWVRETWAIIDNREFGGKRYVEYRADSGAGYPGEWPADQAKGNPDAPKWKSPRFMFKKYARIWLEITDIRVERLQEISEEDAYEEGVITNDAVIVTTYCYWFKTLWNSLAKKNFKWKDNPWVWVISFKKRKGAYET